ncbi:hypothetical protein [Sphingobium yanoikuyae]|uniref:hypothetical protein n=1 Tax=Sphingobium yanoikuyae TaxID=13690 RepID=UPI002FDDF26B
MGRKKPDAGISFASMIDVLTAVFGDSINTRATVISRYKSWQHTGLIQGAKVGLGRNVSYTDDIVWTAILLAEFQRIGFPRETAAALISQHRSVLDESIVAVKSARIIFGFDRATAISIDVPALAAILKRKGVANG